MMTRTGFHGWCRLSRGPCCICDEWPELRGAAELRRKSLAWFAGGELARVFLISIRGRWN